VVGSATRQEKENTDLQIGKVISGCSLRRGDFFSFSELISYGEHIA
jgi:hypothetical protein